MLILTRSVGETIKIGNEISVSILGIRGNQARIGIAAPKEMAVHRQEIWDRIQAENPNKPVAPGGHGHRQPAAPRTFKKRGW